MSKLLQGAELRHRPSGPSPRGVQKEAVNKTNNANKVFSLIFSLKFRVLKLRFLAFTGGPGGFRELQEAGRNHFHLSWYLLVPGITSHVQKSSWGKFYICVGYFFLRKLGLDSKITSWDLKYRIPR